MTLQGRSIVFLPAPGYQELELWYPVMRSREEGATVTIAADGALESHLGYPVLPDKAPAEIDPAKTDAVFLPGVVVGAPAFSESQRTFLESAMAAGAVVAAAGSGVQEVAGTVLSAATPDDLPALFRSLRDALASTA